MIRRALPLLALPLVAAAPPAEPPAPPPPLVEQVDLKETPLRRPGPGEAMIVLRVFAMKMAGDNRILFHRLDPATGAPVLNADRKPVGAKMTFGAGLFGAKMGVKALRVAIVPAGDYVLAGRTFNLSYTDAFCLGAPRFTLAAGDVAYVGDYEMIALAKMADGERRNAMPYSADTDAARTALAALYPDEATRLTLWQPVDGKRLPCRGDEFVAYAVTRPAPPVQDTPSAAR